MTTKRPSTPPAQQITRHEFDTITKTRFFDAYDDRGDNSMGDVLRR
jgi:hypothetical protein